MDAEPDVLAVADFADPAAPTPTDVLEPLFGTSLAMMPETMMESQAENPR